MTPEMRASGATATPLSARGAGRRWGLALATFLILGGLFAWQWREAPAHEEVGIVQERLARAALGLQPGDHLAQTITCRHDGLRAVEVTLVRYRPDDVLPDDARLTLEVLSLETGEIVATTSLAAVATEHNQRLRFSWAPLAGSGGKRYRLIFSCNGDHALSYWASGSEAYAGGELWFNDQTQDDDLVFTTFYAYPLADVLRDAAGELAGASKVFPAALLLLALPGWVGLLYLAPERRLDLGTALAMTLALSLAFWPLLLLWTSVVGLRLDGWPLWVLVAGLIALLVVRIGRPAERRLRIASDGDWLPELALALILLLALATRGLQVREMVLPNWVDSVHHTMITQLIAEHGLLPADYLPYLPVENLHYHFGFHANAAAFCWLGKIAPHQSVLLLGQLLNASAILGCYALARQWSGERWAGVGAALVAGLLAYMPSYYVSWGRYTQLAGLLILPAACLAGDWLLAKEERGWRQWALATALVGGLALTHYRVIIFFALWWLCRLGLELARARFARVGWRRVIGVSLGLLGLTLLAVLPWVIRFATGVIPRVGTTYGGMAATEVHDNSFPSGLLKVGWTWGLLWVAAAGAVWAAVRKRPLLGLIPVWCGLCLLVANLHWLGLRDIWLVHNLSVVISFWLPVSVLCGWLLGETAHWLERGLMRLSDVPPWRSIVGTTLLLVCLTLGAWRGWYLVDIINRVTMLANEDDLAAIEWIDENLAADARLLVNNRKWQGELRVGTDGGYWIPLLAKRETDMPCVIYYQGMPAYRDAINDLAYVVERAESADAPELLERLAADGITHVYVGSRGGKLEPKWLDASEHYQVVYQRGPVRVYALRY